MLVMYVTWAFEGTHVQFLGRARMMFVNRRVPLSCFDASGEVLRPSLGIFDNGSTPGEGRERPTSEHGERS